MKQSEIDNTINRLYKVGVVGATGYAGVELVRLLLAHPKVQLEAVSSVSFHGKDLSEIYPGLRAAEGMVLAEGPQEMLDTCDVLFASLPHGLSQELAADCAKRDILFIDLGADFRLEDEEAYEQWYGGSFLDPALHKNAIYGLCEWNREEIKGATLIANPGCYPTSVALGLYPALKSGLIKQEGIVVDAKSGVTGAGRGLTQGTHFPENNEAFSAYKAGGHRHLPEIEQTLSKMAGSKMAGDQLVGGKLQVTFTPHLLPINRGILSTIYCDLLADFSKVRSAYLEAYQGESFVTVLKDGEYANTRNVRLTNNCHISLHEDSHTGKLIICSAIDNMIKGAAGQAIQNMNLALGLEETMGLPLLAPAF